MDFQNSNVQVVRLEEVRHTARRPDRHTPPGAPVRQQTPPANRHAYLLHLSTFAMRPALLCGVALAVCVSAASVGGVAVNPHVYEHQHRYEHFHKPAAQARIVRFCIGGS